MAISYSEVEKERMLKAYVERASTGMADDILKQIVSAEADMLKEKNVRDVFWPTAPSTWRDAEKRQPDPNLGQQHLRDAMAYAMEHTKKMPGGLMPATGQAQRMKSPFDTKQEYWQYLRMRLRVSEGEMMPFSFMDFYVGAEKTHVFVVHNNVAVTIEDSSEMFPSDSLVAALRLLIG